METLNILVSNKPVVVFSQKSCTMCNSITTLFLGFGVNPTVYEIDALPQAKETEQALIRLDLSPVVPAVFIGGQLVGGADEVASLNLSGRLIPMLKRVGALS